MRKVLSITVCLFLMLAGPALAAKGGNKPPPVDYQALIDAETQARIDADTTLQNNIDAEATIRENEDAALQGMIDLETQARIEDDNALQSNITDEATTRQNEDAALQSQIDDINTTITSLSPKLYAKSCKNIVPDGWTSNAVCVCSSGDTLVGGLCRFDKTVTVTDLNYNGAVIDSSYESWNCVYHNTSGSDTELNTTSICME